MDSLYYTLLFVWIWQYQPRFPHFPRNLFFDSIEISHFMWALHLRGWPWVGWGGGRFQEVISRRRRRRRGRPPGPGPHILTIHLVSHLHCIQPNISYLIWTRSHEICQRKIPNPVFEAKQLRHLRVICDIWKRGGGLQSLLQYFSFELTIVGYNSFSALDR